MIGVVGPEDSIDLIRSVAETTPGIDSIVFRSYVNPKDAVKVAREMERSCDSILFSGRLPYALSVNDPHPWKVGLAFVPHTASDFYRTLTHVLRENAGQFVSMSLDVLSRDLMSEISQESGMPEIEQLYSFDSLPDNEIPLTEELIDFHQDAWRRGDVSLCVTCLGVVHEALEKRSIPSRRVEHSRGSIREALERASYFAELRANQATGIAVAIVQVPNKELTSGERYEMEIQELRRREVALKVAKQLRGQVTGVTTDTITVTTSRGVVETIFERLRSGQRSALEVSDLPEGTIAGFGIDITIELAEKNALTALDISRQRNTAAAVFPNGTIWTGELEQDLWTRDSNLAFKELSEHLGLGPLAFSRLLSALRKINHRSLTARQLGEAYGIEARSARRLLNSLTKAGFALENGKEASRGAGRPQAVFEVDLESMIGSGNR